MSFSAACAFDSMSSCGLESTPLMLSGTVLIAATSCGGRDFCRLELNVLERIVPKMGEAIIPPSELFCSKLL